MRNGAGQPVKPNGGSPNLAHIGARDPLRE
jgi:hypothetical protein